jgi:peptidyl-prolyl cis-trans isomerase B (cyclophilin B)
LAAHFATNDPANKPLLDSITQARVEGNQELIRQLNAKWSQLSKEYSNFDRYQIPESHREIYQSIGGTPHLDQSYTVFGEVIEGLEVVDQIAAVETDRRDRPMTEVRILSMTIIP